ncbi:CHAT domain-containing protein [Nostoc favosum]|uniref:CHAT domain-containing protein n=1 Tax=Nostoc favosum CHAB5714 TaxID=2780399 RepID=A0ABS8IIP5_9NOSO|nr:CHAT domain-containing protein [Nostoc favosum]MCC5603806.1 CHAT domain-containing protein [Nostoc favosum CHAB5714]
MFEAIEIMDLLRNKLKDDQKISIFEQQAKTYNLLQQSYIGQNKIEQALEASERGKARSLIDLLSSKSATNNASVNNLPTITQLTKIAQQQKATVVEYSVIDESFQLKTKDEMSSEKLYIWVVQPTGKIIFQKVDLKSLKIPLKQLVAKSRQSIGVGGRGIQFVPKVGTNQQQNLQQLYQILIQPIAKHLPKNPDERVIFIPHESLFLVPFPALKEADNKYLIEKHTILTAPAIQLLDYTQKNPERLNLSSLQSGDVLLVGNPTMPFVGIPPKRLSPLPGAEKEARTIGQLLKIQPLIGKQATKSAVLQKLQNAKVIHLATHGLLDGFGDRIPGAIVLSADSPPSPQQTNKGLLKATEIIDLKLKADLVVLSACDTGRGEITGDGVVGLSRSLLGAGASSIVVSLWALDDDSTSELMQEFYKELQRSPDKAKALRQAMLKTMQKHPSPAYWAAFTIIGNAE